jgi:hypothetical protein
MAIVETLAADHPMTVRQVFYRLTAEGVIPKTEAAYKNTVCRLLADMRRAGEIPYYWLADATRWQRKPRTFSSVESALRRTAETYRRALWDEAPVVVEIWLEKEALAGVLVEITDEWDVPLMVTRGYPSMSVLYSAAGAIAERHENGQRTHIYYFGDRDPSGVDIDRTIRQGIGESLESASTREFQRARFSDDAFEEAADFERIAVTESQIAEWALPTRPTKKRDTRSKSFKGDSVELDAIPPDYLRRLARDAIERHSDPQRLKVLQTAEDEERRVLERLAAGLEGKDR